MLSKIREFLGLEPQGVSSDGHAPQARSATTLRASASRPDVYSVSTDNSDILSGYEFQATLDLRTPLRVLKMHNRIHEGLSEPPDITTELWQGCWTPMLKEEFAFLPEGETQSSEFGYVPANGGDLLPFLIAVRAVSESSMSIQEMELELKGIAQQSGPGGTPYSKFMSTRRLINRVLPRVAHALPVSKNIREELVRESFRTLGRIEKASDQELLKVKGLGPNALRSIREFLSTVDLDRKVERFVAQEFQRDK